MGEHHDLCTFIRKLAQSGYAALDARRILEFSGLFVDRLVDVHAAQHCFALHVEIVQCFDSIFHVVSYLSQSLLRFHRHKAARQSATVPSIYATPFNRIASFRAGSGYCLSRADAGQLATQGRAYIVNAGQKRALPPPIRIYEGIRSKCNGSGSPSLQSVLCLPGTESYVRALHSRCIERVRTGCRILPAAVCAERKRTIGSLPTGT